MSFYQLTTRAEWGADPLHVDYVPLPNDQLRGLVFHYTGGPGPLDFDHAKMQVRAIQHEHIQSRGFRDIAYSFLVSPQGQVFEGRGWRHRSGAHGCTGPGDTIEADANDHYPALCYLGGPHTPLTDAAKRAFVAVRHEFLSLFGHGLTVVKGHRDVCSTDCPGPYVYPFAQSLSGKV